MLISDDQFYCWLLQQTFSIDSVPFHCCLLRVGWHQALGGRAWSETSAYVRSFESSQLPLSVLNLCVTPKKERWEHPVLLYLRADWRKIQVTVAPSTALRVEEVPVKRNSKNAHMPPCSPCGGGCCSWRWREGQGLPLTGSHSFPVGSDVQS